MKIVLIGFMGSGKSTVGLQLASRLGYSLFEADHEILQRAGFESVSELFEKLGEKTFRDFESLVALELRDIKNTVISPGGGMIIDEKNRANLKHDAITIYLKTSFEIISQRVTKQADDNGEVRPLFKDQNNAAIIYNERLPIYENAADVIISTDNKEIGEVCDEIIEVLKRNGIR